MARCWRCICLRCSHPCLPFVVFFSQRSSSIPIVPICTSGSPKRQAAGPREVGELKDISEGPELGSAGIVQTPSNCPLHGDRESAPPSSCPPLGRCGT